MTLATFADIIIITYACERFFAALGIIVEAIATIRYRRRREHDHKRWVDARVAARLETEARLRAEGRWDNYEIQDAMNAAGEQAVPGYHPSQGRNTR